MIARQGVRDALLAAVLFGLSTPVAKVLVGDLPPQLLAGLLYFGSGAGLAIFALLRSGTPHADPGLHSADIPFLAGAISLGGIVAPVLLRFGFATAAIAASCLACYPVVDSVVELLDLDRGSWEVLRSALFQAPGFLLFQVDGKAKRGEPSVPVLL